MATIDYKEKYEQALEVAQRFYNNSVAITNKGLEDIFPELKESEDERIRKAIIATIHLYYGEPLEDEAKEMIAWLEKQGEQKPADKKGMNLVEEEMTPFQKEVFCIIDTTIEEEQGLKQVCDKLFALASNEIKQKPAWSEEDEENLNWFEKFFRAESVIAGGRDIPQDKYLWLKSLKERYTWKPSDLQMETLENVRKILHTNDIYSKANNLMYNFEELIRTLKKLREK